MAGRARVEGIVESLSTARLAGLAAVGVGLPVLGTAVATGIGDVVLVALSAVMGGAATWAAALRHRWSTLPLELSGRVLVERGASGRRYRFRLRLGRGRAARQPSVRVELRDAAGSRELEVLVPAAAVVGPWTAVALDPVGGDGALHVEASVESGGRSWATGGAFDASEALPGRFAPGFTLTPRGRVRLEPSAWDAVQLWSAG